MIRPPLRTPSRCLVLFTRSPAAERRAKRLPPGSERLFEALIEAWTRAGASSDARLLVVAPETCAPALRRLLGDTPVAVVPQSGVGFGQRLEAAASGAFGRGARSVILAGGDVPPPPAGRLEESFRFLEVDAPGAVIAPSPDGGANLIGLSRPSPGFLARVRWRSPSVARSLAAEARGRGWRLLRLPALRDVNARSDLESAWSRSRSDPAWVPFRGLLLPILAAAGLAGPPPTPARRRLEAPRHGPRAPPAA